jgi:AraC family transcriptional regulator
MSWCGAGSFVLSVLMLLGCASGGGQGRRPDAAAPAGPGAAQEAAPGFSPALRQLEPSTVAYLTLRGPYAQVGQAFGRLYGWIGQHGLSPAGPPAAAYLTDPAVVPQAQAAFEAWVPVGGEASPRAPDESGVGVKLVFATLAATAVHTGPYDTVGRTYEPLLRWLGEQGYEPAGPAMEVYLSDPERTAPEDCLTEVRVPVRRRGQR